jgi:DNA-directed RNA polymerase subunit K/omega
MEFGKLVSSHEGWGMRVMFVPDDEIDKTPAIALQESREGHLELSRLKKLKPQGSC